jgi:polyphosphate kinase 2 (PPK2 family)
MVVAIKNVMSGANPQGRQVFSFKQPSSEELDHDFLWRYSNCLSARGRIGKQVVHRADRCGRYCGSD